MLYKRHLMIAALCCFGFRVAFAQPTTASPSLDTPTTSAIQTIETAHETVDSTTTNETSNSDEVDLQLGLRAGQTFRVTQTSQVKTVFITPATRSRRAQKQETWSNDAVVMRLRVLDVQSDGSYRTRITYESFSSRPLVIFDGTKATQSTQSRATTAAMSRALQNQSLEMTISPRGVVSELSGLRNVWRAIARELKIAPPTPEQRRQAASEIESLFNEKFVVATFERGGFNFPDRALRIGESWNRQIALGGALPFAVDVRRTLQSRARKTLTITESGTLRLDNAQLTQPDVASSFAVDMRGTYTGTTLLDELTRFPLSTRLTQRFSGTVSVKNANGRAVSTSMNGRVFIKTTSQEIQ